MILMSRTVAVICIIGCLQYVIPLVRALPPEGENPLDAGIPPIPSDFLVADSEGSIFKDSIANSEAGSTQAIINNVIQTSSEVVKSGAVGGTPLTSSSFNTDIQSSQDTSTQVGSGSSTSTVTSTQGGSGDVGDGSSINRNFIPSTSTSAGQTVNNGFLATVAGRTSSPPRMRTVMFGPARLRNTMQLRNNRLHLTRQPLMTTSANRPTRAFNVIQRPPTAIMVPFTVPASAQSFTSSLISFEQSSLPSFASPLTMERRPTFYSPPPEMFRPSFFSEPEIVPRPPYFGLFSDFSSTPFRSTPIEMPTASSFSPVMSFQSSPEFSSTQTFISPMQPNFAVNPPPVPRSSQASLPLLPPFAGFSGPSGQFANDPETSVTVLPPISISSINPQSTIEIQPPPPPAQYRQSSMISGQTPINLTPMGPLDSPSIPFSSSIPVSSPSAQFRQSSMISGQTPITVTPLAPLDSPSIPFSSSIPVSPPSARFRQSSMISGQTPITVTPLAPLNSQPMTVPSSIPVAFQTTPAFSVPHFAPFTLPMHSEGTSILGFTRVPSFLNQAGGNIVPMGGTVVGPGAGTGAGAARAQGVPNGVFSGSAARAQGVPNGVFSGSAAGAQGVPNGVFSGSAARAQGVPNGVFSAGIQLPSMLTQFNDFGTPIISPFQAF